MDSSCAFVTNEGRSTVVTDLQFMVNTSLSVAEFRKLRIVEVMLVLTFLLRRVKSVIVIIWLLTPTVFIDSPRGICIHKVLIMIRLLWLIVLWHVE